jgi:hypothetical protein
MRWAFRIISWLFILSFGYIWAAGQGGFARVNQNLCDLWSDTFGPAPPCQFNHWILELCVVGVFVAVFFVLFDLIRLVRRWLKTRNGRSSPTLPKEINLHDFLRFVGIDPTDRSTRSQNKAHAAFVKLRRLARDGLVKLRGRPGFKYRSHQISWKPAEPIEPGYWRDANIFCLDVLGAKDAGSISTMPDDALGSGKSEAAVYRHITIDEMSVTANFKRDEF